MYVISTKFGGVLFWGGKCGGGIAGLAFGLVDVYVGLVSHYGSNYL